MKTFRCDFGRGCSVEIQVTDAPPEKGKTHVLGVEWTGQTSKHIMRPYMAWMNGVNQLLG